MSTSESLAFSRYPATLSRSAVRVLMVACVYLVATLGARMLIVAPEIFAPVSPAAGILLSALLWLSGGEAVAVTIAVFFTGIVANRITGIPLLPGVAFSAAHCAAGVVGALALKATLSPSRRFDELRNLLLLLVLGGGLGIGFGALLAAGVAVVFGYFNFVHAWVVWFHAGVLGLLIIVPFGSDWNAFRLLLGRIPRFRIEWSLLTIALCCITIVGVSASSWLGDYDFALPFLMFPLLVWTALRFGVAGSTIVSFAITFIALIGMTVDKSGFLSYEPMQTRVVEMQLFLISAITSALVPSAVLSERQRAAVSLAQSERRNRTTEEQIRIAAECAELGAFSWNLSSDEIILTSEAYEIYGLPADHPNPITRKELESQIHPEDRPKRAAAAAATIYDDREYDVEYRVVYVHGEIRWVHVKGRLVQGEPGGTKHVAGVVMDVTKRKLTEEALIRTEKLASAGRLAATVAHEINNPLEGVTNILYLLEQRTELPEQELVRLAQEQLQRVANITRQTLQFYRDAGRPQVFDAGEIIKECAWIYAQKAQAKGVEIEARVQAACTLIGQAGEIRQVISNLLGNAIDASSAGGRVIVRARYTGSRDERSIKITVMDNGSGISPELRTRIFEAFFTTKGERGTGLGLWISAGIVSKHNGTISMRSSDKGRGTVFTVLLPAETEASRLQGRRRYEARAV